MKYYLSNFELGKIIFPKYLGKNIIFLRIIKYQKYYLSIFENKKGHISKISGKRYPEISSFRTFLILERRSFIIYLP